MNEDSVEDGNYLVRVCAQVMTRDDSKGGWVPMGGGGLSNVSVRKRPLKTPSEDDAKHEYLIFGKRITDQTVVLSCTIKKDFQYNKVMPTFHHWKTGDKKFGLTFQTAADARAFDRGVRQAVEDLLDGNIHSPLKFNLDVGEEDVFMALDLPIDSRSSSGSSTNGGSVGVIGGGRPPSTTPSVNAEPNSSSPYTHPHANHHHLHRMHYISKTPRTNTPNSNGSSTNSQNGNTLAGSEQRSKEHEDIWIKHEEKPNSKKLQGFRDNDKIEVIQDESLSSYVEFTKQRNRPSVHEYSYPVVDALKMDKRDSITSFKKHNSEMKPPLLPTKSKNKKNGKKDKDNNRDKIKCEQSRCRHCHEMFTEEDNERGSCEFAPDGIRSCINAVTCISCAQCMLYHCMSDAEGDYNHHPCSCNIADENCKKRWIGLTLLSFFVPCLWCYLPLRACHKCGVSCGICGGRHEAP